MKWFDVHTHIAAEGEVSSYRVLNLDWQDDTACQPVEGFCSAGVHPWKADSEIDWVRLESSLSDTGVKWIGEIGLDAKCPVDMARQEEVFARQAALASRLGKPVILHNVGCDASLLKAPARFSGVPAWVMHGFRGKAPRAIQLVAHGFYLSFGFRFQAEALKACPLDRLFLETDQTERPIQELYREASAVLGLEPEELDCRIWANLTHLFPG